MTNSPVRVHSIRSKIEDFGFLAVCPVKWSDMSPADPDVRFCDTCQKQVYLCASASEFAMHTDQGHCVAVESLLVQRPPAPPPAPDPFLECPPPYDPTPRITAGVPLLPQDLSKPAKK